MEKPRASSIMWGATVASIAAFDYFAPDGDTMSERLDPLLERPLTRALLYTAVGGVALHLVNLLPERIDPLYQLTKNRNRHE